jgi:hypothetical protein
LLSVEDLTDESSGPCPVFDLGDRFRAPLNPSRRATISASSTGAPVTSQTGSPSFQMSFGQSAGLFPDPSGKALVVDLLAERDDFGDLQARADAHRRVARHVRPANGTRHADGRGGRSPDE